ncbi:hypothetical protein [Winogradskyella eximia]|uniref:hypothetical protein n=1 Tax=Winogradskyella eximia TaxID=262006 RepID=UPI002491645C|nr:hypothetical protein [Winogradskyella eximia]
MKKVIGLLLVIFIFSCSDDDSSTSLDLNLLYGQWYKVDLCQEQNSLLLNSDGTYESFSSGAIDCNNPEPDTYKFTGTYTINGNFYNSNVLTSEIVIDGTNLSVFDFEDPNLKREILELSEISLVIKSYIDNGDNHIQLLGEVTYEH